MAEYHELVIAGNYGIVKGFVTGFLRGRGFSTEAVFSQESSIRGAGLRELVKTWTGMQEHLAHVIVAGEIAGELAQEVANCQPSLHLEVLSDRRIKSATFKFHYKIYARVYGEEVKGIFADVPKTVKINYEHAPRENLRADGKGIEMYAPEHEYELSAEGTATGSFDDIFPFFRKVEEHPLIQVEEIHLEYAT